MESKRSGKNVAIGSVDRIPWNELLDELCGKEKGTLRYEKFRAICASIFGTDEVKENQSKVREIFVLFDRDGDEVLKDQEWKTFCDWLQVTMKPTNVLLVVDVQNDFIDGSLALRGCGSGQDGADVIDPINRLVRKGQWDKIIYSLDWHPENHISFYENVQTRKLHPNSKITKDEAKAFDTVLFSEPFLEQKLWPKHCVMDTWGAQLHKDLFIAPFSEQVRKGQNPEMEDYSVFFRNTKGSMELQNILPDVRSTHLYVCGLAYDVCVKETCLDGLRLGYPIAVIDDCCRGVDLDDIDTTRRSISQNGGLVTRSDRVLSLVNDGERSLIMSHQSAKLMTPLSSSWNGQ